MSVLVPPMSIAMMSAKPDSAATWALATTPPAGPDSTVCTGFVAGAGDGHQPAGRLHDHDRHVFRQPEPLGGVGEQFGQAREISLDDRQHVGVQRDRAGPLVLAELGENVGRDADRDAGQCLSQDRPGPPFVRRVGIGVQKAYRHRRDPVGAQPLGDTAQAVLVERRDLVAGGIEPAAHRMAILARDERLGSCLADVVEARPVLPPDQQQVAKPLVRDEGDAGAAALKQRVGRGGHAVPDIDRRRRRSVPAPPSARRSPRTVPSARFSGVVGTLATVIRFSAAS